MAYEASGPGILGPYRTAGAPSLGTNAVQTLTFGGTPTGGTYRVALDGLSTGSVIWNNVNTTLLNFLQGGLDAAFGTNEIVATAGTLTAGIGTVLLTFSGPSFSRRAVSAMTVVNNLVGTSPTVAVALTTPGVNGSVKGAPTGAVAVDTTAGKMYILAGGAWVVVGSQT